jgi:AraC-like DNA-binding protein
MYREIKPSEGFGNLIDSFWTFSNNTQVEKFKIHPDNCTDIIFDLSKNKAFISGIMSCSQNQELKANSNLIGVRFKTENFSRLTEIPLIHTRNIRTELREIIPNDSNVLEQLNYYQSTTDKLLFIQKFIRQTEYNLNKPNDKLISSITAKIKLSNGNINIKELATSNFISLRQLERRFKNNTGLTLKEFSSIIRFNNSKRVINNFKEKSLSEIAFEMDFFDHSHMTNEFKRISGENPSYFR